MSNLLIGISLLGFLYTFWPILEAEWDFRFGSFDARVHSSGYTLVIPRLKIYSPVIAGVNPYSEPDYAAILTKGIAQAQGTATPGKGKVYLFAHSSEAPWLMTRQNSAFYRLPKINKGDEIRLHYDQQEYTYRVTDKKIVSPTDTQYLHQSSENHLILQTCYPVGTDFQRLLVFAKPVW